jgi:hypothetical protein
MIVELLDYRPRGKKEPILERPEQTRVVLHPTTETLWADICLLNQKLGNKWTDREALDIEARILVSISTFHSLWTAAHNDLFFISFFFLLARNGPAFVPRS